MSRWTIAAFILIAGCHPAPATTQLAPAPSAWRTEPSMHQARAAHWGQYASPRTRYSSTRVLRCAVEDDGLPHDALFFMMGLLDRLRSLVLGDVDPAEQYVVRGFHVVVENTRPDIETTVVLRRLDDALALIESVQPWRFAHLARDVDRFWIVRYPCRGAFFADTRTCMTELTFLARTDITAAPVASSILHEGMHARVNGMGVSRVDRDMAREERICRRAELAFGRALPADLGQPVIERAEATLLLADSEVAPTIDWVSAQRRQEAVDSAVPRTDIGLR